MHKAVNYTGPPVNRKTTSGRLLPFLFLSFRPCPTICTA
jgi:hypothetical protein